MMKRSKKHWMHRTSTLSICLEVLCLPLLLIWCVCARFHQKAIQVGLGPEPLINNVYHQKALQKAGYTAETFVSGTYFITDAFDIDMSKKRCDILPAVWRQLWLFARAVWHYECLIIYFNGGPLFATNWLAPLEPHLLNLSRVKTIVMPYGSDVQDPLLSPNLFFRHTLCQDYPQQKYQYQRVRQNIDRWTKHADWVISGCEWVDYLYHWNTLQLAHFSIDTMQWQPIANAPCHQSTLRILHAPNHQHIKGTSALKTAVERLQSEGYAIELIMLQGVANTKIHEVMKTVDVVADQFVIGWYAMFAIEAMAMAKPVMGYLRDDLLALYQKAGLLEADEIPIINSDTLQLETTLRWVCLNRDKLPELGQRGRSFVQKHHSLEKASTDFHRILESIGV